MAYIANSILSISQDPYNLGSQTRAASKPSFCLPNTPPLVTQVHATAAFSQWLPNPRAALAARMLACWASSLASSAPYRPWSVSRFWLKLDRWPAESWSSLMGWPCDSTLSSCAPGQLPKTPHMSWYKPAVFLDLVFLNAVRMDNFAVKQRLHC